MRFDLPAAYGDPAFVACLKEAADTPELLEQFQRLYHVHVKADDADSMRRYAAFIHDCVYMRIGDNAIEALRAAHATRMQKLIGA